MKYEYIKSPSKNRFNITRLWRLSVMAEKISFTVVFLERVIVSRSQVAAVGVGPTRAAATEAAHFVIFNLVVEVTDCNVLQALIINEFNHEYFFSNNKVTT